MSLSVGDSGVRGVPSRRSAASGNPPLHSPTGGWGGSLLHAKPHWTEQAWSFQLGLDCSELTNAQFHLFFLSPGPEVDLLLLAWQSSHHSNKHQSYLHLALFLLSCLSNFTMKCQ